MDFYDLCRFCLKFVEINERKFLNNDVKDQFEYLTNEKLLSQVGSDFSCQACLAALNSAHSTKEIFLKSQEILVKKTSFQEPESLESFPPLNVVIKEENLDYDFESIKEEEPLNKQMLENIKALIPGKSRKKSKSENKVKKPRPCDICGAILSSSNTLRSHKQSIHQKILKFFCDVCGRGFFVKKRVRDHLKSHFKIKDVECEECGKFFKTRDILLSHRKIVHLGIKPKFCERTCEVCGKLCRNKTAYDEHIRAKHTGEKFYVCDYPGCDRRYPYSKGLARHKKEVHMPRKTEICTICLKEVKNLRQHEKVMHKERGFICTYEENGHTCGRKYTKSSELQKHINVIHRGVRSHFCDHCDFAFKNKQDLRGHILNIHEKKKIQCELCPTLMGSKNYYSKHIKSHHRELDFVTREHILTRIRDTPEEKLFNYQK